MNEEAEHILENDSIKTKASAMLNHAGFRKYFKNVSWSLAVRFTTLAISFLVSTYVARYLGPSNYGMLSYAISFVGIFTFISTLGIDSILYRSLVETPERRAVLMGTSLRMRFIAGAFAMLLAIGIGSYLRAGDISFFLIIILSTSYLVTTWQIVIYEFQAEVDQKTPSLITLAVIIILNTLKLIVVFFDKGVLYLAAVLALEPILYALFFVSARKSRFPSVFEWHYDSTVAKSMLRECWPLIFSTGFVLVYSRIDQVLLKNLIDNTAVGIYDSAVRIAETWYVIPGLISSIFFPAIINAKKISSESFKKRVIHLTLGLASLAAIASLATQFLAPFIMHILYGTAYAGGITVLKIYMWSGIWMSIGLIVQNLLVIERSTKMLAFTNMGAMILNIVLNLVFVPMYGINGAALATSISYAVIALPLIPILRKK